MKLVVFPHCEYSTQLKNDYSSFFALFYPFDIIRDNLRFIIGHSLTDEILDKILNSDFSISKSFIRKCKIRLLFINSNFVRMLFFRFCK